MLSFKDILATQDMIDKRHLDIRTITMGISLLDCAHEDVNVCAQRIYDKITKRAENLVKVGQDIEWEFGIPSSISVFLSPPLQSWVTPATPTPMCLWPLQWTRQLRNAV